MPYSDLDSVRVAVGGTRKLVELADQEDTAALLGPDPTLQLTDTNVLDVINRAIAEADGIINGYLKQRSAVPLSTPPDEIKAMSAKWVARILRRNVYNQQPIQEDLDAEKIDRAYLADVAKGIIQLGIDPTPERSSLVVDKAAPRDTSLAMSRDRMKTFI